VITAGITSFYMFRLIFLTFHGVSRVEPEKEHHVHDSPPVMAIPLIVLAVLATVGDFVGCPTDCSGVTPLGAFSRPFVAEDELKNFRSYGCGPH
jgi:NADH-quinone oxidoreductase subunit L